MVGSEDKKREYTAEDYDRAFDEGDMRYMEMGEIVGEYYLSALDMIHMSEEELEEHNLLTHPELRKEVMPWIVRDLSASPASPSASAESSLSLLQETS